MMPGGIIASRWRREAGAGSKSAGPIKGREPGRYVRRIRTRILPEIVSARAVRLNPSQGLLWILPRRANHYGGLTHDDAEETDADRPC